MAKAKSSLPKRGSRPLTLGLAAFAKFSAMEGLALTPAQERDMRALEKRGASPEERRRELAATYGKPGA